jgi:Domain of unknown function (DUF6456)
VTAVLLEESIEMTERPAAPDRFDPNEAISAKSRNALWFRVLRRLEAGALAKPTDEGYTVGSQRVPVAVICDLARHDMIESVTPPSPGSARREALRDRREPRAGSPVYVISPPGRAFLRRVAAAKPGARTGRAVAPRRAGGVRQRRSPKRRAETSDVYRAQHRLLEADAVGHRKGASTAADEGSVIVNRAESPLGWLRHRKDRSGRPFLSDVQFEAGEELRKDFEIAGMTPRMTTDLSGRPAGEKHAFGGQRMTATERQVAAKQRLDRAIAAVGPDLSDVVLRVCCFLEGIEAAERALGWPTRSGKLVLGIALDRLARHYGFV